MLLKHPSFEGKVVAVLEGDTDIRLFRSLMDEDNVKIEAAVGKSRVSEIVCDLSSDPSDVEYSRRLFGICDADFMHITGDTTECENVFVTDTHDIETMILNSPAVRSLISEYAPNEEIANLLHEELVNSAMDAAYKLGTFRYINHINNLNINFKGLRVDRCSCVDGLSIEINHSELIKALIDHSSNLDSSVDTEYLLEKYSEHIKEGHDKLQFCSGHDVTQFISCILSQRELSNDTIMNQKKVEGALRLAYGVEYFKKTKLYKKLDNWRIANSAPAFLL